MGNLPAKVDASSLTGDQSTSDQYLNEQPTPIIWAQLTNAVKAGDDLGARQLYELLSRGIRYYLARQLGEHELEDKVDDTFLVVVNAIRRGDLRDPSQLMSFTGMIVRRQVAAYVKSGLHVRRQQIFQESGAATTNRIESPEQAKIIAENAALMKSALQALSQRDRDILVGFYLQERSPEQICQEMSLTETQFRLLKSRAKAKFGKVGRKLLAERSQMLTNRPEPLGSTSRRSGTSFQPFDLNSLALAENPTIDVFMAAAIAFKGIEEGKRWLAMPNEAFESKPPLTVIDSVEGRGKILNELALIEHGMF